MLRQLIMTVNNITPLPSKLLNLKRHPLNSPPRGLERAQTINDFALLVHDIIIFGQLLTDFKVIVLDPLSKPLLTTS